MLFRSLGVDYGQGFAIGRPAPLVDLLTELPLLASAEVMTRSLHDMDNSLGDSGILNAEFVH